MSKGSNERSRQKEEHMSHSRDDRELSDDDHMNEKRQIPDTAMSPSEESEDSESDSGSGKRSLDVAINKIKTIFCHITRDFLDTVFLRH